MNNPVNSYRIHVWFLTLLLMFPSLQVFAVPQSLTGELVVTLPAKVNGSTAKTGMTILPDSNFEVGKDGMAAVNLDRLGRVTVQSETNFLLKFDKDTIGGDLTRGTIVLNIPCGVEALVRTPKDEITIPADQGPLTLTVEVTPEGTRSSSSREVNAPPCVPGALGAPRSFGPPINPPPAPPALGGWALPLFLVGGGGLGAALAVALSSSVFPVTTPATPVIPG